MTRTRTAGWAFATVLVLLAFAAGYRVLEQDAEPAAATTPSNPPAAEESPPTPDTPQGLLYGRITTLDGARYEGRLRWGAGDQEAFWGDYFNGSKDRNSWVAQVPPERLPRERHPVEVFGITIAHRESRIDVDRQFMARFGEIARIEAHGGDQVRVTLKSGTVFDLDRLFASDFDDGVRVWDARRGVVDLGSLRIRTIELLSAPSPGAASDRLHGTVRTRRGNFTGFVGWNRQECFGSDKLDGRNADGRASLRFDTLRSIARRSRDSSLVTLLDGREIELSGRPDVGEGNGGVYVDDPRYGRVVISWDAFERVDFSPGASGPGYDDFPPGRQLTGSVTTVAGRRLAGRLVYDLNESETTDTLDASAQGVDYTIPFGLIASIVPAGEGGARVTLQNGEELRLERAGDLGEKNAGLLIFVGGSQKPEYVPWNDVKEVEFDRPAAMYPPLGEQLGGLAGIS